MDEPTNHLDIQGVEELEATLANYPGTLLVVSHDRYFVSRTAGSILEVRGGKVRLFRMGYDDYRQVKAKEVNGANDKDITSSTMGKQGKGLFHKQIADTTPGEKTARRERQQQEKAERQEMLARRRHRRTLQQRLDSLEHEIEQAEAKVIQLEERLAEPSIYNCYDDARVVMDELKEARQKVESLYGEWEKATAQLEELPLE